MLSEPEIDSTSRRRKSRRRKSGKERARRPRRDGVGYGDDVYSSGGERSPRPPRGNAERINSRYVSRGIRKSMSAQDLRLQKIMETFDKHSPETSRERPSPEVAEKRERDKRAKDIREKIHNKMKEQIQLDRLEEERKRKEAAAEDGVPADYPTRTPSRQRNRGLVKVDSDQVQIVA